MNKHLVVLSSLTLAAAITLGVGCKSRNATVRKAERPVVEVQPPQLVRTWKADLNLKNDKVRELHLSDEYLFALTDDNYSYVFDRASGSKVHVSKINGRPGAPVVMKDFVVYPTESHLEVFNRSGRFVRSINLDNTRRTDAVTAAGRVIVGVDIAARGRVLFVDITKPGNDVAPILTAGALTAKPAVRGGLTFVGDEAGKVYAISEDLVAAWALPGGAFETDGAILADLAADAGTTANVYAASTDTKLYALSASTGQVRWQYYAGVPLTKGPTVTADTVYIPVDGQGLVAIDKAGSDSIRKPKWAVADAVQVLADDAENAYVLDKKNRIFGVNKKTGKVAFANDRDDLRTFAVNTKNNVVFAATSANEVIAATPVLKPGSMGEIVMTPATNAPVEAVASSR